MRPRINLSFSHTWDSSIIKDKEREISQKIQVLQEMFQTKVLQKNVSDKSVKFKKIYLLILSL